MSEEIENIIEESLSPDRYCLVHNYIVSLRQKVEQLENIRKEAIEYVEKSVNNAQPFYQYLFGDEDGKVENLDKLLNILNKGSE